MELVIQHDIQTSINNEATCSTLYVSMQRAKLKGMGENCCRYTMIVKGVEFDVLSPVKKELKWHIYCGL